MELNGIPKPVQLERNQAINVDDAIAERELEDEPCYGPRCLEKQP
jgi:hypothetical protein